MNRRDSIKALGLGAIASSLLLKACASEPGNKVSKENLEAQPGREAFEIERINRLNAEQFFDRHELATIAVLADIIIPKDDVSGSATDAGVPDFIEFIVKDMPEHQVPMRGGLKWLDLHSMKLHGKPFIELSHPQQIGIVEEIAYPNIAKPEVRQGVAFFNRMRSLTASGFYTTQIGIDDIGYKGNMPNQWKGVPPDVLAQYGLTSDTV